MGELVRETIPRWRVHDRHLLPHLLKQAHHRLRRRIEARMQAHVKERELDLAQKLHAALEISGGNDPVIERPRQCLTGFDMPRHSREDVPLPTIVLHELRGKLHGVPLDAGDARHAEVIHAREQLVQPVAELMKERDHLAMGEEGGPPADGCRKVAREIGHGRLHAARHSAAVAGVVHPGATTLGLTRVEVNVELAKKAAPGILQSEEAHVRMPGRPLVGANSNAVERLDQAEEPGEHRVLRKVLLHFLVRERVSVLAQLLARPGDVPRLHAIEAQAGVCEGLERAPVALGVRPGTVGEVLEEGDHLGGRGGHLGRERYLGVIGEPEQARHLCAQAERSGNDARVVPLRRAEFGCARHVSTVNTLSQAPMVRVLHHREVRGRLQRELAPFAAVLRGRRAGCLLEILGQARQFRRVAHVLGERVGGIEDVFLEAGAQCGKLFLQRLEPCLVAGRELRAAQAKVAQAVVDEAPARGAERGVGRGGTQRLEPLVEPLVLALLGEILRHARQGRVVRIAKRRRVDHVVEVCHLAPGARQALVGVLDRLNERVPCRLAATHGHAVDGRAALAHQGVDSGQNVLRREGLEARQA